MAFSGFWTVSFPHNLLCRYAGAPYLCIFKDYDNGYDYYAHVRKARADALALFEKVAARQLAVEPADESASPDEVPAAPSSTAPCPPRMLD